ncbi:hypothetical protein BJX65DRAFT_17047 [Aspergillus insuetus]
MNRRALTPSQHSTQQQVVCSALPQLPSSPAAFCPLHRSHSPAKEIPHQKFLGLNLLPHLHRPNLFSHSSLLLCFFFSAFIISLRGLGALGTVGNVPFSPRPPRRRFHLLKSFVSHQIPPLLSNGSLPCNHRPPRDIHRFDPGLP